MEKRITIEATIPTTQYGNVKPMIEMEGSEVEDMSNEALRELKRISDMVAAPNSTFELRGLPVGGNKHLKMKAPKEIKSELTGVSLLYDEDEHRYTDKQGNKYLSGSVFPDMFFPDFDKKSILDAIVNKYNVNALDVSDMWDINGTASTSLGTSIHAAMECYGKYCKLGDAIGTEDRNKALNRNPLLRRIVESFYEVNDDGVKSMFEVFVADDKHKLSGFIDKLLFVDVDKKIVRIQDFKTDADVYEKKYQKKDSPFKRSDTDEKNTLEIEYNLVGYHVLQLSFYAYILKQYGYTVDGIDIFWLNMEKLLSGENPWELISRDVVDVSSVIEKLDK